MCPESPMLAVVGPTASGKTNLAVGLALALDGEVVSADSMQVYRGMNIATAKPTPDEMHGVPHHLMSFLAPDTAFSVADYVRLGRNCIEDIRTRGHLPVVAGGTGLYVDALVKGIDFSAIPSDENFRRVLEHEVQAGNAAALYRELERVDPESARSIHVNNTGRLVRALEVYHAAGVPLSLLKRRALESGVAYACNYIGITAHDRQVLYQRIDARVDRMMEQGLLEEARRFYAAHPSKTAVQAIGYKELKPYLDGTADLGEAVDSLKRATRCYAKRQLTWFRRNTSIHWLYLEDYLDDQAILSAAMRWIQERDDMHGGR